MNAPENITEAINQAHDTLAHYDEAMSADQIAYELAGRIKPTKAHTKEAVKQLKQLADLGMIEMEPRAGGVPFYRLISATQMVEIPLVEQKQEVAERDMVVIPPPPAYDPASVAFPSAGDGVPTKTYPPSVLRAMVSELSGDSEGCETDAPAADADGWIPWIATADSVCPVTNKSSVRVRLRGGEEDVGRADIFRWNTINCTPIVAYKISQPACADFATTPELQYLAPEDYKMPPADPSLLASANKMLCERMNAIAEQLRAGTIPALESVTGAEDLAPHVKTICDALADLRERLDAVTQQSIANTVAMTEKNTRLAADLEDMTRERDILKAENLALKTSEGATPGFSAELQALRTSRANAINEADRLRAELAIERQAREALQEQSGVISAAGYIVRAAKRKPRTILGQDKAREAALSAIRAGAQRAEVFAIVPVGAARRGAEWRDA